MNASARAKGIRVSTCTRWPKLSAYAGDLAQLLRMLPPHGLRLDKLMNLAVHFAQQPIEPHYDIGSLFADALSRGAAQLDQLLTP